MSKMTEREKFEKWYMQKNPNCNINRIDSDACRKARWMMSYRVVGKNRLVIFEHLYVPIPYSEPIDTKAQAERWILLRGLNAACKVMSEDQFVALNGGIK